MVMMENFHHIHNFLCQRNIPCLESKKREAQQRSREHMEKFITTYLGQPLERLKVRTGPWPGPPRARRLFPKLCIKWCSNLPALNPVWGSVTSLSQGMGAPGFHSAHGFPKSWHGPLQFSQSEHRHQGKVKRGVNNAGAHSWFLGTVHTLRNSKSLGFRYFTTAGIPKQILGLNEHTRG